MRKPDFCFRPAWKQLRRHEEESRFFAQVGEWLKPADCKSAPPSEVRRFESFPVHQLIHEPLGNGAGRICGSCSFGLEHDQRLANPFGDAGDSGNVRGEDVVAPQGRDASRWRNEAGRLSSGLAEG